MALLDDLLSTLNFVTPARSSSAPESNFRGEAGSGLSGLANAGNRAMGEQEQALDILSRMSGQQKMELFGGPSGEYLSLEEEAADPRTGTANRIVYTMSKMMPAEDSIRVEELPNPVPRPPVDVQPLSPAPVDAQPPALDEDAMASADREFGQRGLNRRRVDANNMSSIENGAVPLRDWLMEQQGEPMSGGDQLSLMATLFLPVSALPGAAVKIGMRLAQIANFLRAGSKGEKALRQIILERQAAAGPGRAREILESARNSTQLPKPHQQFGSAGALRSPTIKQWMPPLIFAVSFPAVCTALAEKFGKAFLIATAE
jgi:hypothetical protein